MQTISGFTLIEVLVAISILVTSLFIPLSIITRYLTESALTENHVKANLLAQEIIEYVRYDRDTKLLAGGTDWFTALRSNDSMMNDYVQCVQEQGDTSSGSYCHVECTADTTTEKCKRSERAVSNVQHPFFVSGVTNETTQPKKLKSGASGYNEHTCDNKDPNAAGTFTTILTIIIPDDEDDVQYAVVKPCVSWRTKNDAIRKVELQETLYQWLAQ